MPQRLTHKQWHCGAVEKRPSVALRRNPRQSTYAKVRLFPRLLRALHLDIFEQPAPNRGFQQFHCSLSGPIGHGKSALMAALAFMFLIGPVVASGAELKPMTFMPHWLPQAQFAGYYVAFEKGFYRNHGIELQMVRGGPGFPPAQMLAKKKVAVTSMFLSEALQQRDKGIKLINVCQLMKRSGFIMVAKKGSGIVKPEDLNGRRISAWENFQIQPRAFFRKYRINVTPIIQGATVNLFLRGGVDAASAMWYNEYHTILNSGWNADELTLFFFDQHGLNFPEDGIYALEENYKKDPDLYRRFVQATLEGWVYAFAHREEALDLTMKYIQEAKTGTNRVHQRWMLARMKDLMMPDGTTILQGALDVKDYERVTQEFLRNGLIRQAPPIREFFVDVSRDKKP